MSAVRAVALVLLAAASAAAQAPEPIAVWPGTAPGEATRYSKDAIAKGLARNDENYVRFATAATLTPYPAARERAVGTGVLVCPGGGYNVLAWRKEGVEVARWLNRLGITAWVLKYRVPRRDPDAPEVAPMQDAQRAMRLLRSRSRDWGVRPDRIGILGFSAGGHLSVMTALRSATDSYEKLDGIDATSSRPDFVIPVYCAYLGSKADPKVLDPRIVVTKSSPPMFTVVTHDDKLRGLHAALLYAEYRKQNVPAELHVFTRGGHGYGLRKSQRPVSGWPDLCAAWLREMGWLDR